MPFGEYEVENPEIRDILRDWGTRLAKELPPEYGFSLLIFSYGEGGNMFYISSAQREDMIKAMREFIEKNEVRQ